MNFKLTLLELKKNRKKYDLTRLSIVKIALHNLMFTKLILTNSLKLKGLQYNTDVFLLSFTHHFKIIRELAYQKKSDGENLALLYEKIDKQLQNDISLLEKKKTNYLIGGLYNRYLLFYDKYKWFFKAHCLVLSSKAIKKLCNKSNGVYNPFHALNILKKLNEVEKNHLFDLGMENGIKWNREQFDQLLENKIRSAIKVEDMKKIARFRGLFKSSNETHVFFSDPRYWKLENGGDIDIKDTKRIVSLQANMKSYWTKKGIPEIVQIRDY
ncbi:hypothetical protein [Ekhidna sp.]|jgi:hypothetical protein|uniref:hypothetical protein n=1 Tax=Ekhidna sp. TaxID=2608089 RepID=UPI0032ED47E0